MFELAQRCPESHVLNHGTHLGGGEIILPGTNMTVYSQSKKYAGNNSLLDDTVVVRYNKYKDIYPLVTSLVRSSGVWDDKRFGH